MCYIGYMPRQRKQDNPGPVSLRMPDDLRLAVEQASVADMRSLHGEILWLLKLGLVARDEQAKALDHAGNVRPQPPSV